MYRILLQELTIIYTKSAQLLKIEPKSIQYVRPKNLFRI